jgi:hypothetical protein
MFEIRHAFKGFITLYVFFWVFARRQIVSVENYRGVAFVSW